MSDSYSAVPAVLVGGSALEASLQPHVARVEVDERPGRFTAWYGDESGRLVGVLTYNADDDYERGSQLVAEGADVDAARNGAQPAQLATQPGSDDGAEGGS